MQTCTTDSIRFAGMWSIEHAYPCIPKHVNDYRVYTHIHFYMDMSMIMFCIYIYIYTCVYETVDVILRTYQQVYMSKAIVCCGHSCSNHSVGPSRYSRPHANDGTSIGFEPSCSGCKRPHTLDLGIRGSRWMDTNEREMVARADAHVHGKIRPEGVRPLLGQGTDQKNNIHHRRGQDDSKEP